MTLITDTAALKKFSARAAQAEFVTVDTEFLRDKTYWPKLCLVQVGLADEAVAIDTLADGLDLGPLLELMFDPKILKVFHASRQDIEIFYHMTGKVPAPLFDSQVAAMVCGYGDAVSYERLVASLAGAKIDKTMRFTDWARRPLLDKQIGYALDDVIHLRAVYEALRDRLHENKREEWVAEEMDVLTNPDTYRVDPRMVWKRVKLRNRNRRTLAILRELAAWREEEAQKRDVPRNRVLRDEALSEIATHPPKTPEDMGRLRAFSRDSRSKGTVEAILATVAKGFKVPEQDCPAPDPRSGNAMSPGPSIDLLKVLLKQSCETHEVAQKLVATMDELEAIALDDKADVPALHGWRHKVFGKAALDLKHGRLALTADGKDVKIIQTG